ncbi:hypothetical protein PHYSODRAFT_327333 [Phytophthora sojae]|uniref:Kazal-like domain-containing protein n=1 Tax=Phytophthora sojae (strain P6497) TaxID=1094619 RepID=G4Z1Q7_PHYSP|nr:hypothetical protein PHYSODRAFT_327333 [Phytophthora sojae]EGZ26425.1 hypothetical protein PHYSODRAFT_327333 [Phytophthora sojae]|eukprot:XP_009521713.1 hypothetical protein PHYSODRAFT_327333 [Phytophthora sojae]
MKFAAGLVLAALAVTAANAGNPAYLRSSDDASASEDFDFSASDSLDASGSDACPDECPDKYEPVRDDTGVEHTNECHMRWAQCLTNDVNNLFVREGTDWTFTVASLFGSSSSAQDKRQQLLDVLEKFTSSSGSGSDQVDLQDIIDTFEEEQASDDSESGSDDDLSWLDDSDSEFGSEDPTLVKGATKGKTPIVQDDSESGSDDDVLVKGGKEPATKSSKSSKTEKATKTGTIPDLIDQLFDDASEDGIIGDESDEEDPTLVKGATKGGAATKGKTPLYEEDDSESESASDEDDYFQQEQLQTSVAEKAATKSSKTLLL